MVSRGEGGKTEANMIEMFLSPKLYHSGIGSSIIPKDSYMLVDFPKDFTLRNKTTDSCCTTTWI